MTEFTKEFIDEARKSITEPGIERYICIPVQLEMLDEIERLQSRIAELEAAQRWIPVSERLPEATGDYIVTCDGWSNSEIAYWNFPDSDNPSGWLEYMQYIWSRKPVKYWMPLPKPPEVQE
jgi:hypothetical protein